MYIVNAQLKILLVRLFGWLRACLCIKCFGSFTK